MLQQPEKKHANCRPWILLSTFAFLIVVAGAHHFWPAIKGVGGAVRATVAPSEDVSLTGIFYTEKNPLALVNGEMVYEQDVIDGVQVIKIHKHKVEFESKSRTWTQEMKTIAEGVAGALPVLLELGSKRCPPCRRMMPILDELKAKYRDKFQIRYIDVWKNPAAGSKYGVRAIPTQIFYDSKGNEVFRHTGFYSKKQILATWKQHGVKF